MAEIKADSNRVVLRYAFEDTFGVINPTPELKTLRYTGGDLNQTIETVTTEEIREDRQVNDLILTGNTTSGGVNAELSYRNFDDFIEAAQQSDWINKPFIENSADDTEITDVDSGTTTITLSDGTIFPSGTIVKLSGFSNSGNNIVAVVASNTVTTVVLSGVTLVDEEAPPRFAKVKTVGVEGATGDITAEVSPVRLQSTLLDMTTLGLTPGQWLKIGGSDAASKFDTAENNVFIRVQSVTTTTIVIDVVPSGWADDSGAGKDIKLFVSDYIINGNTEKSFSIEREFDQHDPKTYQVFTGMRLDTFNIALPTKERMEIELGFQGLKGDVSITRTPGVTELPLTREPIFNTSGNFRSLSLDGSEVTGPNFITESSININNNMRRQDAVGTEFSVGIASGNYTLTGDISTYFSNADILLKAARNGTFSYDMRIEDSKKQSLLFDMPSIEFSLSDVDVSAVNTDSILNGEYQALSKNDFGWTLLIARFDHTEA